MTVSSTQVRVSYAGDGTSVSFPIPFPFYLATDLLVVEGGSAITSGYSISGGAGSAGTLTMAAAPANGVNLQVILNVPLSQLVNLVDGTAFPSATINQINDRAVQGALRLNDLIARSIRAPDGDVTPNMLLAPAAMRSLTFPFFDVNGNLTNVTATPGTSNTPATLGPMINPRTLAEIANFTFPVNQIIPALNALRQGAVADWSGTSGTDNTSAIQTEINVAHALSASKVTLPAGPYYVASPLTVQFGTTLVGEGVSRQALPGNWISGNAYAINGTQLFTNAGVGTTTGSFLQLETGATLSDMNVWYSGQTKTDSSASIVQYPPTVIVTTNTAGDGSANSDNATLTNFGAINCYEFMRIGDGVHPVGRTIVENVFANPFFKGITFNTMSGDVAMCRKVFIENLFTTDGTNRPNLHNYLQGTSGIIAFDLQNAQGVNLTDCIALACGYGIRVTGQSWLQATNFIADVCSVPFYANGADRVMVSNSLFVNNSNIGQPSLDINGAINQLAFMNCFLGAYTTGTKVGMWGKHTSGTVAISNTGFSCGYPAVLNTGGGQVQLSNCYLADETNAVSRPVTYFDVCGAGISINGGPMVAAGSSLGLTNINPTSPAATGWTYTTPANVTAITGGVKIQGVGNNSITYRAATVSAGNNNTIFWGTQIYVLTFNYQVTSQAGSPRLNLVILNDVPAVIGTTFQLCNDAASSNSALPEAQTFAVTVLLAWNPGATQLEFSLPSQLAGTIHQITNLDIKQLSVPLGFTGLEFLRGIPAGQMPMGYYNPVTGTKVMTTSNSPVGVAAGVVGDLVINSVPTVGQPKGWVCTTAGAAGTAVWTSQGNL